jgi:archaellum component FlaC
MVRPALSEWEDVFGFTDDPTPGDADMLESLAHAYRSVSNDAGDALPTVSGLKDKQVGEGKSMDKLRDKLGDLAKQVDKLHSSYDEAAKALTTYVDQLRDHQRKADHALKQGRDAKDRLASATEAVRAAGADISRLDAATPPPPDDQAARRSAQRAMDRARDEQSTAQAHADDAQADLDAARLLAEDARELRETDASVAARALDDARDDAVPGYSLWEKIRKVFSLILGIISGVLGVLAMLVPGLQGIGLALTIGSFITGAAAFGINMSISAETGDWDPLDIVLSVIGLGLGGGAIAKSIGGIAKALKGIPGELGKIPVSFKEVPTNISSALNGFRNIPSGIADVVKGLGSKIDSLEAFTHFRNDPLAAVRHILGGTLAGGFKFHIPKPTLPASGLGGVAKILGDTEWTRPDIVGFFLTIEGFIYGPASYAGHGVSVKDDTYLPGTT